MSIHGRIDDAELYDNARTAAELQGALRGGDGGGIYNAGALNATNVTISGNTAVGQVVVPFNGLTATSNLLSSTIAENDAAANETSGFSHRLPDLFIVNQTTIGSQERSGDGRERIRVRPSSLGR